MANDVHYVLIFVSFFLGLGLITPLINAEFVSSYTENDVEGQDPVDEGFSASTSVTILLNILALPFWTFGLPGWVNLWFFLPIRIAFLFVIGRNIWIGGGS